jgi:phage-related protein
LLAREELDQLPEHGRAALAEAIARFRHGQERRDEVKKLADCNGLWEIRVRVHSDCFRAIFFYDTSVICVCVTAIKKNQQRLPPTDKQRALRRMAVWQEQGRSRGSR